MAHIITELTELEVNTGSIWGKKKYVKGVSAVKIVLYTEWQLVAVLVDTGTLFYPYNIVTGMGTSTCWDL